MSALKVELFDEGQKGKEGHNHDDRDDSGNENTLSSLSLSFFLSFFPSLCSANEWEETKTSRNKKEKQNKREKLRERESHLFSGNYQQHWTFPRPPYSQSSWLQTVQELLFWVKYWCDGCRCSDRYKQNEPHERNYVLLQNVESRFYASWSREWGKVPVHRGEQEETDHKSSFQVQLRIQRGVEVVVRSLHQTQVFDQSQMWMYFILFLEIEREWPDSQIWLPTDHCSVFAWWLRKSETENIRNVVCLLVLLFFKTWISE